MNDRPQEGSFQTSDGISIFYRWIPGKQTDFFITLIHGFAEHSGRYDSLMRFFSETGRAVFAYDLRGHGRSGGERGTLHRWPQYWSDLQQLVTHIRKTSGWPSQKMLLFGHSMGGLIALEGARQDSHQIQGLILSSPCLGIKINLFLRLFNQVIAEGLPFFQYPHPVAPEKLSHDVQIQKQYASDPLILKSIRAGLLREMMKAMDQLKSGEICLDMPLWILAAGEESVVDLNQTLSIYARIDAPFKKIKILDSCRHEIFNELESKIAYDTTRIALAQIQEFSNTRRF